MAQSIGDGEAEARPTWGAREIARRNRAGPERPLSPVMKTAATACELAHGPAARKKGDSI